MMITVETIEDAARFGAIRAAWQGLWDKSGGLIFQHHEWIAGWMEGVRDRKDIRLKITVAWDGETLIGALPLAVHRRTGLRVLSFAGQLFSDYCDGMFDPAYPSAAISSRIWDGVRRCGGFDLISLQQVRPDAQCRALLDGLSDQGDQLHVADRQERCMRIENRWATGAEFFRSLNKKGRNNHTRGKRILSEMGGEPVFRVVEPSQSAEALFDEIWRLKEIWLRATEPDSPLLGADRFVLRAILNAAWRSGLAKIFLLECGGKIAAASINFIYANKMEAYLTSYDSAFERASPGTILIVEYAQWSFDRGLTHVDFLRGEEAFKFRMANAETTLGSYAGARTLVGQLAVSGHRWLARRRPRVDPTVTSPAAELEVA